MESSLNQAATDRVLRAITDDGAFRVVAVRTTDTVRGASAAQGVRGQTAKVFADLLTATILVRETMAPDLRVQGILQSGDTQCRMVADSHPEGGTRGLVQQVAGTSKVQGGNGVLQMMRSLHNGALHQGVVEVPASGGVSSALMQYMQDSEQVVSFIALGCVMQGDEIAAAGGYIVQLLPEVGEGPLMLMEQRLRDFSTIDHLLSAGKAEPEELLKEILFGMPFTQVGEGSVSFRCPCSHARLAASLATLPRHEIESFIQDGKVLEIECDYCRREYKIAPETLKGLLRPN